MQQTLTDFNELNIQYDVGNADVLNSMEHISAAVPFNDGIIDFLNDVSKFLLSDKEAKKYPDIITFAFWIRKASVYEIKKRFTDDASAFRLGRGTIFHIAPSNVPVNYAYSLVAGLLCGNKNIVRIPSKDFPQIRIINSAILHVLNERDDIKPYICLIKYGHDIYINDALSSIADVRVIWGGDNTISELRKSPLKPRAYEVTFADRYSLSVIDSGAYLAYDNKSGLANDFYNDTYLTDQNACTSPRAVVWIGENKAEAQSVFWNELHKLLSGKYELSGVQAVNKLTSGYMLAACKDNIKKIPSEDNLIVRMKVSALTADLMELKDNSGYFFEYDCEDIMEIKDFCNDTKCQTISYFGNRDMLMPLISCGIAGIDRIVPIGKTMDFDLIWDGYNLFDRLTRFISIN